MSINPPYAEAILDGTKLVEFRKRPLPSDVTHVVIYATAPASRVVGTFSVSVQHTGTPHQLWRRFRSVAGIARTPYFEYFGTAPVATAIEIGELVTLDPPIPLTALTGLTRPPQSYQYVNPAILHELGATARLVSV